MINQGGDMSANEFRVQAGVFLQSPQPIDWADLNRVFDLYLPFIGASGYGLYHLLVNELIDSSKRTDRQDHNFILDSLNLSLVNFVKLRRRLEAVGLLKTFYTKDSLGEVYTYQLYPALSARSFFKEALLAGLLFKYVGEERYLTLQHRYDQQGQATIQGRNISANFLQVFQTDKDQVVPVSSLIETPLEPLVANQNFDFQAMVDLVHGTDANELNKHHSFILAQQALYGLSEQELATALTRNISLDQHTVNENGVMQYLAITWGKQAERQSKLAPTQIQTKTDTAEQVTDNLQGLYQAAENLTPQQFLSQIKEGQGGFVSTGERRILTDLISRNVLPIAVLNILIYQVLVGMENASLNRNLVDTIANSWAKAQVTTPQHAVAYIKKRQSSRSQGKKRSYQQRPSKVEPTMVTGTQAANTNQHSSDDVAAALAELKQMRTKN